MTLWPQWDARQWAVLVTNDGGAQDGPTGALPIPTMDAASPPSSKSRSVKAVQVYSTRLQKHPIDYYGLTTGQKICATS